MDMQQLGLRIKTLRNKNNLTQERLGEVAGLNGKYIGEVERGAANISIQNLDRIAVALNVTLLSLLDVKHQKSRSELKSRIEKIIDDSDYETLSTFYRVLTALTQ